jgi:hypothetical protein
MLVQFEKEKSNAYQNEILFSITELSNFWSLEFMING